MKEDKTEEAYSSSGISVKAAEAAALKQEKLFSHYGSSAENARVQTSENKARGTAACREWSRWQREAILHVPLGLTQ